MRTLTTDEVLINVTPMESRVALVENGVVQELFIERTARRGLVGNIYRGKVVRVLPGMQAAFIDIGLERTAFLHINEVRLAPHGVRPQTIQECMHDGMSVTVQVMKDMMGSKGARLTMDLSIPSRYLVYMPYSDQIGVSQKIEEEAERERLKQWIRRLRESSPDELGGGFIIRTVAEGAHDAELDHDMAFLLKLWRHVRERAIYTNGPALIYEELPLSLRTLRDIVGEFVFIFVGQLLMLIGTIGRLVALRLYLQESVARPLLNYGFIGALFYISFALAHTLGTPDAPLILFFFSFYGVFCVEFFLIGIAINKTSPTLGSRLVIIAGLSFSISLSLKAILIFLGFGAADLYGPGIDQAIMILGQFVAITLSNIGFLRIFLERNEQNYLRT